MRNRRKRSLLFATGVILAAWLLVYGGYLIAQKSRMTVEKVSQYINEVDFGKLVGDQREKAIRELAAKLNALSIDERRRMRREKQWEAWFSQMTEEEKVLFIELTMPTGFKQMLAAFEELPEEKRKKAIDDTLRRMRERANEPDSAGNPGAGTNGPPPLSPELEQKVRTIGLKTFYSESSAQTKAELAPVLEEIQRSMERGRALR